MESTTKSQPIESGKPEAKAAREVKPRQLPPKVETALAEWDTAAVTTMGPLISTSAFNTFAELRANLRAAITAALAD